MLRLIILLLFCMPAALAWGQRNSGSKTHHEDLSALRPRFDTDTVRSTATTQAPQVTPVLLVNDKVNAVLDSIDRLNNLRKFVPGFTIQIYSGQSREDANNSKKKLSDELDMKADLQYMQPKFSVKVGRYFTSLDAQKDLVLLRHFFPNAILVPETVAIR